MFHVTAGVVTGSAPAHPPAPEGVVAAPARLPAPPFEPRESVLEKQYDQYFLYAGFRLPADAPSVSAGGRWARINRSIPGVTLRPAISKGTWTTHDDDAAAAHADLEQFVQQHYPVLRELNPTGNELNCNQAVIAVDHMLNDVTTVRVPPATGDGSYYGVFRLKEKYQGVWVDVTNYDDIIAAVRHVPGSRGVVYVSFPESWGHVINVVDTPAGVVFLDGQAGTLAELWPDVEYIGLMLYHLHTSPITDSSSRHGIGSSPRPGAPRGPGPSTRPSAPISPTPPSNPVDLAGAVSARIRPNADGLDDLLGPDPFGVRRPPAAPDFLVGYDYAMLPARKRAAFFRAIDQVRPGAPATAGLRPDNLADGPVSEGGRVRRNSPFPGVKTQKVPHLAVSIWLGGPLYEDGGNREEFMGNLAAGKDQHREFEFIVLTDVSRSEFDAVRDVSHDKLSGRAGQVLRMLAWAERHGVRLVNVDEVFNAEHGTAMLAAARTERARGNPNGYAGASDLLRVLFLRLFGGLSSDGDNKVTGDVARAAAAAADSPFGFAVGVERHGTLNNSVLAAAAGSSGAKAYLDILRENHALPFSHLISRRMAVDPSKLAPDAHTELNQSNVVETPADLTTKQAVHRTETTMAQETIIRTGPSYQTFDRIAQRLGLDDRHALPHIPQDVYVVESSHSWIAPQAAAVVSGPADLGTLTDSVIGAVTALHRETRSRPGGVYLPAAARTIDRLPAGQRQQAWEIALQTFHNTLRPETVIDWASSINIDLPPGVPPLLSDLFPDANSVQQPAPERSPMGDAAPPRA